VPLDPAVQLLLEQLASAGGPPLRDAGVEQARQMIKLMALADGEPEPVARAEARTIPGPAGALPVRVYASGDDRSLRPILLWLHGGGWVIGDLDTADPTCRKLANRSGALVVSVDYRLAPEDPHPAASDDAIAALRWLAANGAELGGDPARIAVGGDSAGGNLAAVTAIAARDEGIPVRLQVLVYPVTDATMSSASYDENAEGYLLTRDSMAWFTEHYLSGGSDPKEPTVSPLHADDLSGVAPALVLTAEFDPLRDEGEALALRLQEAGVAVEQRRFDGMIHGFFALGTVTPMADEAVELAADRLQTALA
jgi:acetyl esterase